MPVSTCNKSLSAANVPCLTSISRPWSGTCFHSSRLALLTTYQCWLVAPRLRTCRASWATAFAHLCLHLSLTLMFNAAPWSRSVSLPCQCPFSSSGTRVMLITHEIGSGDCACICLHDCIFFHLPVRFLGSPTHVIAFMFALHQGLCPISKLNHYLEILKNADIITSIFQFSHCQLVYRALYSWNASCSPQCVFFNHCSVVSVCLYVTKGA